MYDLHKLIAGFRSFRETHFEGGDETFKNLVRRGQSPKVMVIACSDSRVDPAIITQAEPGELFVVRNVANLVPPYENDGHYHGTSAALEFAVTGLEVEHIVIIGHAQCGGIMALVDSDQPSPDTGSIVGKWMEIARQARDTVVQENPDASTGDKCHACEKAAIRTSLTNLRSFPWVEEKITAGSLQIHGWYFDITEGALLAMDVTTGQFVPIETAFATAP